MASNCGEINLIEIRLEGQASNSTELTFMSAFESSPVHCLKSRPSGNRHRPGNAGTAEILCTNQIKSTVEKANKGDAPTIDIINDLISTCRTMFLNKIFIDPTYQVVFKSTLDKLMEQIRRKKFMNVGPRKFKCKRL
jgi:hypothetical protein